MRPIVAPQMSERIAETLKTIAPYPSASAILKQIEPPTFQFAKSLDALKVATQLQLAVAEAMKAWRLPPAYANGVADALEAARTTPALDLAPLVTTALHDAVDLVETPRSRCRRGRSGGRGRRRSSGDPQASN